jgi:hypothetical protein
MSVLQHLPDNSDLTLLAPQSVLEMLAEEYAQSDKTKCFVQIIQCGEALRFVGSSSDLLLKAQSVIQLQI